MTPAPFPPRAWATAFAGITRREMLRFVQQRGRFLAALVRPLVWLFIFAAGVRAVLGLSITPPYQTYVLYQVYVTPGLVAMIQLFNRMQSSLSMVYDRETGAMRTLLVSPFPRWFLLGSKLSAGVLVSIMQAYVFLAIAWLWRVEPPLWGYVAVLLALILSGRMWESSMLLHDICALNPFTHAVELIRFALYLQVNWLPLAVVPGCLVVFFDGAVFMYDPAKGLWMRRKRGR
ncbi:MAG: multidrug ABC transporter permease [Paracoccus sp. (in: a-proteobacteria)]|uniref:ABC transporter permease n=1 Tax=Paracoccus sp. TaxID=267 RepID=UPI0026DFC5A6|nr:ABC transporter permease [Paracoccus sp. (in: a-proteobacteria)]MDO5612566.1 multidrug ABC transporter permease [Paracoccus sp. (in: a-proteobacteria)]